MRKALFILMLLFSIAVHSQQWIRQTTGQNTSELWGSITDTSGNVYVTGGYTFGTSVGSVSLTNNGSFDFLIAKYDGSGNLIWAHGFGGPNLEIGKRMAIDTLGNIYVTGVFDGTTTQIGSVTLTSFWNGWNTFVAKFTPNGTLIWAKQIEGGWWTNAILVDHHNDLVLCGSISNPTVFGNDTLFPVQDTSGCCVPDAFVCKMNDSGNFLWARRGGGKFYDEAMDITVDGMDNIYMTGYIDSVAEFGGQYFTNVNDSSLHTDACVVKYNAAGNFNWLKHYGAIGPFRNVFGRGIRIVGDSMLCFAGNFDATANFDSYAVTSAGSRDIFIAAMDTSGNIQWVNRAGGNQLDNMQIMTVSADGNLFITGYFNGAASFGPFNLTSSFSYPVYTAKIDPMGNFCWAGKGEGAQCTSLGMCTDRVGNTYVGGDFQGLDSFGNLSVTNYNATSGFLIKYDVITTAVNGHLSSSGNISVYPNPASDRLIIEKTDDTKAQVALFDMTGRSVKEYTLYNRQSVISLEHIESGVYIIEVSGEKEVYSCRIIVE